MAALPTEYVSSIVPDSPAKTVTAEPVLVFPADVATDAPDEASIGKPELATVTVSPGLLFAAHTFTIVNVATCGVFVSVHVIAVSDGLIVSVFQLNAMALPVQARVAA